jgi:hypothetical protein
MMLDHPLSYSTTILSFSNCHCNASAIATCCNYHISTTAACFTALHSACFTALPALPLSTICTAAIIYNDTNANTHTNTNTNIIIYLININTNASMLIVYTIIVVTLVNSLTTNWHASIL